MPAQMLSVDLPFLPCSALTENTRVSYPIEYIANARVPCVGPHPKNIILLCCDAFGVLPPVSRLTTSQAMYHFISGYTAKVRPDLLLLLHASILSSQLPVDVYCRARTAVRVLQEVCSSARQLCWPVPRFVTARGCHRSICITTMQVAGTEQGVTEPEATFSGEVLVTLGCYTAAIVVMELTSCISGMC